MRRPHAGNGETASSKPRSPILPGRPKFADNQSMKLLIFAGSTRQQSFNRKLAAATAALAHDAGAEVSHIELADFDIPMYNADLEARATPPDVLRLKALMYEHPAWIVCTPEYNASYPALVKNTFDWVSSPVKSDPTWADGFKSSRGKVVGVLSASPGGLGAFGANHARRLLKIGRSQQLDAIVILEPTLAQPHSIAEDHFGTVESPETLEIPRQTWIAAKREVHPAQAEFENGRQNGRHLFEVIPPRPIDRLQDRRKPTKRGKDGGATRPANKRCGAPKLDIDPRGKIAGQFANPSLDAPTHPSQSTRYQSDSGCHRHWP